MRLRLYGILFFGLLFLCAPHQAKAACTGSSPNLTSTPDAPSVNACVAAAHCGDTITLTGASATYTTGSNAVTLSAPAGCGAGLGITVIGATACSGGCGAGSGGVGLAFTGDTATSCGVGNTCITISNQNALQVNSSNTSFVRLSGVTVIAGAATPSLIQLQSTHLQVGFRMDHVHVIVPATLNGPVIINANLGYGLIDHMLYDDAITATSCSASPNCGPGTPIIFGGIFSTHGYTDWTDPTNFGTNQSIIVEDSQANFSESGAEGFWDGYYGCKPTIRHSIITGNQMGGGHGTDSGGYRGCLGAEMYNNTITNNNTPREVLFNTRSGSYLFHDNIVGGSTTYAGIDLQFYRILQCIAAEAGQWGCAGAGLNWTPISATTTNNLAYFNTLNAPDWQALHSYAAGAVIGPLTGNAGQGSGTGGFNFENQGAACVSAASNPTWTQTVGNANGVADGTCTDWVNVGGGTTPSAAPGTADGFLTANPDTVCSSGSCGRFFDSNGGVYPFRDQPGTIHDQVIYGNYQWNNTATGSCTSACYTMATDPATTSIIVSGRDFFNGSAPAGYTPYTYPDPLQGAVFAGMPTFSPVAGTYTGTQNITITSTPSTVICWNTTGAPATNGGSGCTTGTLYTGPVAVSASETIYAVGGGTGYSDSSVASAAYTINSAGTSSKIATGTKFTTGDTIR